MPSTVQIFLISITFLEFVNLAYIANPNIKSRDAVTYVDVNQPWNGDKYYFKYETNLGTLRVERGFQEDMPDGNKSMVVLGFYTYIDDDGKIYMVEYIADSSGFNPKPAKLLEDQVHNRMKKSDDAAKTVLNNIKK